jgi:hypothetical protein
MIDYYNSYPTSIRIIDKMNEELSESQDNVANLETEITKLKAVIEDYKDNVIFDLLFNHDIDSKTQEKIKEIVYKDEEDIFKCKRCECIVHESYDNCESGTFELYRQCLDLKGIKLDVCEYCFDATEDDADDISIVLFAINEALRKMKENPEYKYEEADEDEQYDLRQNESDDLDSFVHYVLKGRSKGEIEVIEQYIYGYKIM